MIMSSEQLAAIFRQWLELSETYAFLGQFVRFKSQREENAAFLDSESPEDLRQGFLLFLVDRFVTPEKLSPDLMLLINTAQFRRILELAWGRFIWDLRERHATRNAIHGGICTGAFGKCCNAAKIVLQ